MMRYRNLTVGMGLAIVVGTAAMATAAGRPTFGGAAASMADRGLSQRQAAAALTSQPPLMRLRRISPGPSAAVQSGPLSRFRTFDSVPPAMRPANPASTRVRTTVIPGLRKPPLLTHPTKKKRPFFTHPMKKLPKFKLPNQSDLAVIHVGLQGKFYDATSSYYWVQGTIKNVGNVTSLPRGYTLYALTPDAEPFNVLKMGSVPSLAVGQTFGVSKDLPSGMSIGTTFWLTLTPSDSNPSNDANYSQ